MYLRAEGAAETADKVLHNLKQKLEIMVVDINEQSNEVWNSKIFNNFSIYKSGLLETLSKLPSKEIFLKEKFKKRNIFCIY